MDYMKMQTMLTLKTVFRYGNIPDRISVSPGRSISISTEADLPLFLISSNDLGAFIKSPTKTSERVPVNDIWFNSVSSSSLNTNYPL